MPKAVSFFLAWSLIIAAARWTHIINVISILFQPSTASQSQQHNPPGNVSSIT